MQQLMYILECLSAKFGTIISWSLDGKSVIIHNREAFADIIIATFFKKGTFDSFCRKMRRWGFTTKSVKHGDDGEDKWAFHHPDFNKAGSFGCCERVMTTAKKKTKKADIGDSLDFSGYNRQTIHEGQVNQHSESSNTLIPPPLFPSSIGATVEDGNGNSFADNKMSSALLPLRNHEQLLKDSTFNAEPEMRREHDQNKILSLQDNIASDPSLGMNASSLHPNVPFHQQNHIGQSLLQNLFVPPVLAPNTMLPFQGNTAVSVSNITQDNLLFEIARRQLMSSQNHDNATLFPHALGRQYPEQFHRQHPLTGRLDDAVMWREFLQARIHGERNQQNVQQSRTQENSSTSFRHVQSNNTIGSEPNASQLLGAIRQDMMPAIGSQGMTIDEYQILLQHLQRTQR